MFTLRKKSLKQQFQHPSQKIQIAKFNQSKWNRGYNKDQKLEQNNNMGKLMV